MPSRNPRRLPEVQRTPSSTKKPLRVLLLEDNAADAALISHELQRSGMRILLAQVDSAESFTDALKSFVPDVVLSAPPFGKFHPRAALKVLREFHQPFPSSSLPV